MISDKNTCLSEKCFWARSSYRRLVGLLAHANLPEDESILIEPCKQVHTFFMRFPIDVVFLDKDNTVLEIRSMTPWKLSPLVWGAQKVLELPEGKCMRAGLQKGQRLEMLDA
jgi:uncharacterized membrane protein (UPF0127 family)